MAIVTAIRQGRVRVVVAVRPVKMIPVVTSVISAVNPVRQAAAIERTADNESFTSTSNASRSAALTGLVRPANVAGWVGAVPDSGRAGAGESSGAVIKTCGEYRAVWWAGGS